MCPLHLLLQIGGPESLVDLEKQIIFEESGLVAPNGKTALMMVASGVISHNAYAKNTRSKMQSKIGHINLDAGNHQSRETRDYERGEDENNGQLADDFSHNGGAQPDRKRSKTCDQETGRKLSRDCRALEREVISHLLAIGSNPELQNPFTGETAAHYAVKHDRADLLRLFLTRGISTWTTDFSGNNLLHTSINWNSHRCFDLISTLFIGEIDAIDFYYGETALMRAVMMMMNKEAHDLVSRGVSLLVTDYRGRNCLHWASIVGNHEMLKTLIDNGVPVNVLDKSNYTPLIYACAEGHFECVKILVDESAKIFVCDSLNRLSWEIAEMRGNLKIAEYLRSISQYSQLICFIYSP
ncbi:MAG: negative regulation of growth rate [Marteilia pararefringens]